MKSVDLWEYVLEECLVLDLVDDGAVVASVLGVMSGLLARVRLLDLSRLEIVDVGRNVKVSLSLSDGLLHRLIFLILINTLIGKVFKSILYRTVGLILIDIFVRLFDLGHILIDFINLLILMILIL